MSTRLEALLHLVQKDENDSFSRYGLAMEYASTGDHAKAVETFNELIRRDPLYHAAYYHLAKTYEALGKVREAFAAYETGILIARKLNNQHAVNELIDARDELRYATEC
ncbi:tetratricopeptide repeat protein [bacterium]|nr:MAG: tetratricopeptide repeat protein [bacterium]